MRNHILPDIIEPVIQWKEETFVRYASHVGNGNNKIMECNLSGCWKVMDHKETVYTGFMIADAIEAYNSITAK